MNNLQSILNRIKRIPQSIQQSVQPQFQGTGNAFKTSISDILSKAGVAVNTFGNNYNNSIFSPVGQVNAINSFQKNIPSSVQQAIVNSPMSAPARIAGVVSSIPYMNKMQEQQQANLDQILNLAHRANPKQKKQLLDLFDQANKSNTIEDFYKQNTPGKTETALGIMGNVGAVAAPTMALAGIPFGVAQQAIVNKLNKEPLTQDMPKAGLEGFQFGAMFGAASKAIAPFTNPVLNRVLGPQMAPINNYLKLAKNANPEMANNFYKLAAKRVAQSVIKEGVNWGIPSGVVSAIAEDADNFQERVANGLKGFAAGLTMGGTLRAGGIGANALWGQILKPSIQVYLNTPSAQKRPGFVKIRKQGVNQIEPKDPLIQEARKYKSAEEFVKAQGKPAYHGSRNYIDGALYIGSSKSSRGPAIYATPDISQAKKYGNVNEIFIDKKAKVFDFDKATTDQIRNDIVLYLKKNNIPFENNNGFIYSPIGNIDTFAKSKWAFNEFLKGIDESAYFRELGYDLAKFGEGEKQIVIYNPSIIKTKSQLADIYNQSIGLKSEEGYAMSHRPAETGALRPKQALPIKEGADPLIQEARKYKSAEEAVKGVKPEIKPIPKGLEPLAEEARKYKSAEEIAPKQGAMDREVSLIGGDTGLPMAEISANKVPTEVLKSNIVLPTKTQPIIQPEKTPSPEDVAAGLPSKIDGFINKVLGYTIKDPTGGNKQATAWTSTLRRGQEVVSTKVEHGLSSENALIRNAASTMQNFFRGIGMSPERAQASMDLRGRIGVANQRAFDVVDALYKSLKNNKASLERINAVLDPEITKIKVSLNDLNPVEKKVYNMIREGLDIVHDQSYANGSISKELYLKNKGKYVPRLYDVFELPPEINSFVTQNKKIVNDLYKKKTSVNDWKIENALNDPVYSLGKRLAQVETNTAIKKYIDFLASKSNLVSDVEKAGFTKLSDSPAYGKLSGKYVLNSAAEDLKGFFFANDAINKLYDVFRIYDRMGIRQLQKKLLTVFNPTTNVGNIVSDNVFGFISGVDPLTINKNLLKFKSNPSQYKQLSDYLMRKGIIGTDITRTDFVNKMGSIDSLVEDFGTKKTGVKKIVDVLSKGANKVQSFYGGTDDVYKASVFKALLDKGFSLEEATRKVADGFQNYATVGKFYDVWAKTPIIGSPFIKFQGDLIRIIKNGAVNNPLGLITFLGTLWGVARLFSKLSGETDADRQTRENRFAAPMISGLNIPLTWQTPIGEINVARYISPFYANNETTSVTKMLPFVSNIQPNKDVASNIAMNANDPLLAGPVQLLVNRDFRGRVISDPNENKYQKSTLTPEQKLTNQAVFLGRQYAPPLVNSLIDVKAAIEGKPNMYGTPQTVGQSLARLAGIKISQYGPKEVQNIRAKEAQFQNYANEDIDKQISQVTKQHLRGEITLEQAEKRINHLIKQKKEVPLVGTSGDNVINSKYDKRIVSFGNQFKYLDKNGVQQTADTQREAEIGVEKADFSKSEDNFKDLGDVVLRKTKDGSISVQTKDTYNSLLNSAKMINAKKNGDFETWFETADKQFEVLANQLQDPLIDELDKITIQNKIDTLVAEYKKYKSYGGFTKPKKDTSLSAILSLAKKQIEVSEAINKTGATKPLKSNIQAVIGSKKAKSNARRSIQSVILKRRKFLEKPYKPPK